MNEEARKCVESCREWYQAFSNFGKGEERSVKELLAVANIIESLSAQLDQVTRERDAETELIGKLIFILKKYPNAATNGCAYDAYMEIKKWLLDMRGVEEEGC